MIIFMNKTDSQKLALLKHAFNTSPFCTIDSLARYLAVSTRTVERYFKELQSDCQSLFQADDFHLERIDGKVILEIKSHLSPHYVLDRLHVEYTERSIEFKLVHSLLLKKYNHINELADELFLSPSSLYRLLNKIEPIMQTFNLRLSFFDTSSTNNFEYEEKNLRAFTYYFYWFSLKGIHLEPLELHKETVKNIEASINWLHYEDWLPSKKEQIRYICAITSFRQKRKHEPLQMPHDIQLILQAFSATNDLSTICTPLMPLKADDIERLFFNLFLRLMVFGLDSTEQKQQIVHDLRNLDLPLIRDCKTLLSTVSQRFELSFSDEQSATFFFDYLLILLYIFYLDIKLPDEFKELDHLDVFNQSKVQGSSSLFRQVQDFYPDCHFNQPIPAEHQLAIIGFICLMIDSQKKPPIRVAIQYSINFMGEPTIKQKLRDVFSADTLLFTTNYNEATLIISDCFAPATGTRDFFYMDSLTDPLRWELLIDFVKDLLVSNGVY